MHPPEADAVGNTGAADALRPAEFRGRDVGRGCGRILGARGLRADREGISANASCRSLSSTYHPTGGGRRMGTPALIPDADEEASTLAGSGAQRRIPQPKRFCDSVGEEVGGRAAGSSGQRVREQVEPDVGIVCGGSGKKAQTIAREPLPAKAIVGKREVAAIACWIGDFPGEAGSVRGEIAQCDRAAAQATHRAGRDGGIMGGELLQGVGEGYASISDQLHQQVRGHDFGQRAQTDERVSIGLLVRARIGLTIALLHVGLSRTTTTTMPVERLRWNKSAMKGSAVWS